MIFLWMKHESKPYDDTPLVVFNESGLQLPGLTLHWENIYDWSYHEGDEDDPPKIFINYYDANQDMQEATAHLSMMDVNKIDFLLLLTHFKGKCG
jgi:hypothetical protein